MNDTLKEKLWDWFTHLTVKRILISAFALAIAGSMYTLWENRQKVFDGQSMKYSDDFYIGKPSEKANALFTAFMAKYPEVSLASLIDANPVANTREVRARYWNDETMKAAMLRRLEEVPNVGDGPLITNEPVLNAQVYSILAGEFRCAPVSEGVIAKAFPDASKRVLYSCRISIPPAWNKATGWITVHLNKWPLGDLDTFKSDANKLAMDFYVTDINPNYFKVTK